MGQLNCRKERNRRYSPFKADRPVVKWYRVFKTVGISDSNSQSNKTPFFQMELISAQGELTGFYATQYYVQACVSPFVLKLIKL